MTTKAQQKIISLEADLVRAKLLIDICQKIGACRDIDEALEYLLRILVEQTESERGSLFLNDAQTGELISRVMVGNYRREIRILNNQGIVGHAFTTGASLIVDDAYNDDRFDKSIDERSGLRTKSILCVPILSDHGAIIGVAQLLNKRNKDFSNVDCETVQEITNLSWFILANQQQIEKMHKKREQETEFLDIVADITAELQLSTLLRKVMTEATRLLKADRGTLFLNDEKSKQLYIETGEGVKSKQIRFPNHLGIAGTVFTSGKSMNIPYAYADLRFNPSFDKTTGYFTRSILCVPVVTKEGKRIGVTQMLNKNGGAFTHEDESRLKAFTAQISIALENAKLFDDVQNIKNYNESILQSMSNGVVTFDEEGKVNKCNVAAAKMLGLRKSRFAEGMSAEDIFGESQTLIHERIGSVLKGGEAETLIDVNVEVREVKLSLNLGILPLLTANQEQLGVIVILDDISSEKRLKSTMSRYMDANLAEQIMSESEDVLGGRTINATVLFSDIRSFTTITEKLGAEGTVKLLNDYFTIMVECIQKEGGMLDKFIGDAIMAGFGIPISYADDEDRGLRCAIDMLRELKKWNDVRKTRGEPPVDIGIGLATGNVVAGNIGSPKRMDYTMIGDVVNLGARIESACKSYSAKLLISHQTKQSLKGTYRIREVDLVVVKGKTQPVSIYEVLDFYDDDDFPNMMDVVNHFNSALKLYRNRKWDRAAKAFSLALEFNPNDNLCKTYLKRCEILKEENPGSEWDGVWVMTTK
jgi:adenylate cyclase